jgi:1-acyl-sn-glycerol-3-phosphate acyltransferase
MSNKAHKKKKWIKPRHTLTRRILGPFLRLLCKIKYHCTIKKYYKDKRQFLILSNHQTAYDQFFVGLSFKKHIYFVTNDDLFSNGITSKLIDFLVKPIPIKKGTTDVKAVMNCMRVAKEGGSIMVFPEGNRTYSGKTGYIKDSIAQLAKALKLPICFYHIKGGFGVEPRWADKQRKGKIVSGVSEILEYESYKDMSNEELYSLICEKLYINECHSGGEFYSRKSAEYIERGFYYCPKCGFGDWRSKGESFTCQKCGTSAKYTPCKEIVSISGDFPFRYTDEWFDAQYSFIRSIDLSLYKDTPLFCDTVSLSEVIPCKKKISLGKNIKISAFGDRFELDFGDKIESIPYESITSSGVLGKNKFNYYFDKKIYQIKSGKRFCAIKYVNIYHHAFNTRKGDLNATLGL